MGVIEDAKTKLDELERLERFLNRVLSTAATSEWKVIDPDLTIAKQIYASTRDNIIAKANELPTV